MIFNICQDVSSSLDDYKEIESCRIAAEMKPFAVLISRNKDECKHLTRQTKISDEYVKNFDKFGNELMIEQIYG